MVVGKTGFERHWRVVSLVLTSWFLTLVLSKGLGGEARNGSEGKKEIGFRIFEIKFKITDKISVYLSSTFLLKNFINFHKKSKNTVTFTNFMNFMTF